MESPSELRQLKPVRLYCDFNDRIGPATFGLRVRGTREDLQRQQIDLEAGMPVLLYDEDGFADGSPAWIIVEGVVATDPTLGFVAEVDSDMFRWVIRAGDPHNDLSHIGQFLVKSSFELTGRGRVLTGSIASGSLRTGQIATLEDPHYGVVHLQIGSVEFLDDISRGESDVALLLEGGPTAERLAALTPVGTLLDFA
jgi:hypothetical protein